MRRASTLYAPVTYSFHRKFVLFTCLSQSNVSPVVTKSIILSHFVVSATCFDSFTVVGTMSDTYMEVDGMGRSGLDLSGSGHAHVTGSLCEKVKEFSVSIKCKEFLN